MHGGPGCRAPLTSHARLLLRHVRLEAQAEAVLPAQAAMRAVVHQKEGRVVVVEWKLDPVLAVAAPRVPRRERALGDKWPDQSVFPSGPGGQTPAPPPPDPGVQAPRPRGPGPPNPPPLDSGVRVPSPSSPGPRGPGPPNPPPPDPGPRVPSPSSSRPTGLGPQPLFPQTQGSRSPAPPPSGPGFPAPSSSKTLGPTLGSVRASLFRTTPQGATPMATTLVPPVLAVWWSRTATPTCRPMPLCSPPVTIQAPT